MKVSDGSDSEAHVLKKVRDMLMLRAPSISKQTWCLTSTETIRLIRAREKGVWRQGKRESIYLSLYCHHQNDSCIKTGSDESHFGVFIDCEGQCHNLFRQCPQIITFEERTAEVESNRGPSAYQPNALPLGQTGSQRNCVTGSLLINFMNSFKIWLT